jgi:hypothetical protein
MAAKSGLDFSPIYDGIVGCCKDLQRDLADILVLLLKSANEDNQTRCIHDAVEEINKLYLKAQHTSFTWNVRLEEMKAYVEGVIDADTIRTARYNAKEYDVDGFFWLLWQTLFGLVMMIPYNHPNQELLVNFLKVLRGKKVGIATAWLVRVPYFLPSHRIMPSYYIQVYGG